MKIDLTNFNKLSAEKQKTVINAGFLCFGQNGYKKASVADIAKAAGVSKASLFQYFGTKQDMKLLFPVLLLCDENGNYVDFDESELIPAIEKIDDMDVHYFTPTEQEMETYGHIYDHLTEEMLKRYQAQSAPVKAYNKKKIENWVRIQMEQLIANYQEMAAEISNLKQLEQESDSFYEKIDIRKKISEKSKALEKLQESFHKKGTEFKAEGEREVAEFNKQFDITPVLLVNIVLKF